jgi:hypothetical protein
VILSCVIKFVAKFLQSETGNAVPEHGLPMLRRPVELADVLFVSHFLLIIIKVIIST